MHAHRQPFAKKYMTLVPWLCIGAASLSAVIAIAFFHQVFNREIALSLKSVYEIRMPVRLGFIQIDFGNGRKRRFQGELGNTASSLEDALRAIAQETGMSLSIVEGKVISVDSVGGTDGEWKIYRGAVPTDKNLKELSVAPGTEYAIRYEH